MCVTPIDEIVLQKRFLLHVVNILFVASSLGNEGQKT